jgi:hypothetical protein
VCTCVCVCVCVCACVCASTWIMDSTRLIRPRNNTTCERVSVCVCVCVCVCLCICIDRGYLWLNPCHEHIHIHTHTRTHTSSEVRSAEAQHADGKFPVTNTHTHSHPNPHAHTQTHTLGCGEVRRSSARRWSDGVSPSTHSWVMIVMNVVIVMINSTNFARSSNVNINLDQFVCNDMSAMLTTGTSNIRAIRVARFALPA